MMCVGCVRLIKYYLLAYLLYIDPLRRRCCVGGWHGVSNLSSVRSRLGLLQPATVRLAERQLPTRVRQGIVLLFEELVDGQGRNHHRSA